MASVTIVFRKDKINKKGDAPIHFRIIKDRKSSYIASGIMIQEDHWDNKKNKVKSCHTNSSRLNNHIANKFTEIQNTVFEYETNSRSLSCRTLRDKVFGKRPTDFFEFALQVVSQYRFEGKIGTYHKNQSIISKLKTYKPNNPTFYDITPEFLRKYEEYLRDEKKNSINTINKDFKFIRKVFNDAIKYMP